MTVLVIDDHEIQRKVLVERLNNLKVGKVLEASDGIQGLAKIQELPTIDLILCDLDMPNMDGLEVIRQLAELHCTSAIAMLSAVEPVVLACAELMTKEKPIVFLGAVSKPVSGDQLRELLGQASFRHSIRPPQNAQRPLEEIRAALAGNQFVPYFQPIVRASDLKPVGAEALARWKHPEYGVLSPARFLDTLEQQGGIDALTWAMIDQSLVEIKRWQEAGFLLTLAINLSGNFMGRRGVALALDEKVQAAGVSVNDVTFEVTESIALTSVPECLENLARIRMLGYKLAADDFGTANASMQQLIRVPFQSLKLDRSFVVTGMKDPRAWTVLETSVSLAEKLHMVSVIEGVENAEELDKVSTLKADLYQGFYFARPLAPDSFLEWLQNYKPKK